MSIATVHRWETVGHQELCSRSPVLHKVILLLEKACCWKRHDLCHSLVRSAVMSCDGGDICTMSTPKAFLFCFLLMLIILVRRYHRNESLLILPVPEHTVTGTFSPCELIQGEPSDLLLICCMTDLPETLVPFCHQSHSYILDITFHV